MNQEGVIKNHVLYLPHGTELLKTGETYFLAAKYDMENDAYTIALNYGNILIKHHYEIEEYVKKYEELKK